MDKSAVKTNKTYLKYEGGKDIKEGGIEIPHKTDRLNKTIITKKKIKQKEKRKQ